MRLIIDPHGIEQASARGVDLSILFMEHLKKELSDLLFGQKLVKTHKGNTFVFKKSNSSDTVYLKTAWASYAAANNNTFKGVQQC